MKTMLAQGDVLLIEVESIPKAAGLVPDGVVARGEATGHAHRLSEKARLFRFRDDLFVDGMGGVLTHEEHGRIALGRKSYRVVIQREFDGTYSRQVAD